MVYQAVGPAQPHYPDTELTNHCHIQQRINLVSHWLDSAGIQTPGLPHRKPVRYLIRLRRPVAGICGGRGVNVWLIMHINMITCYLIHSPGQQHRLKNPGLHRPCRYGHIGSVLCLRHTVQKLILDGQPNMKFRSFYFLFSYSLFYFIF